VGVNGFEAGRAGLALDADVLAIGVLFGLPRHAYPAVGAGVYVVAGVGVQVDAFVAGQAKLLIQFGKFAKAPVDDPVIHWPKQCHLIRHVNLLVL